MKIVKHKEVDLTLDEIFEHLENSTIPKGCTVSFTEKTVTIEPEGKINLFGDTREDYEIVFYNEEVEEGQ